MLKTKWTVTGLLALNVLLGAALYSRLLPDNKAYAQGRGRADLITVAGHMNQVAVLYVLDPATGRLAAIAISPQNQKIMPVAATNVADDFSRAFRPAPLH